METYQKLKITLRYFLLGKEYFSALDALEYAAGFHTGTRKDGVTPEFQHQVEIVCYLRTLLPCLIHPQETLTAALLHDVPEDYGVPHQIIADRYGPVVSDAVWLLDKHGKVPEHQFRELSDNAVASIVKGADRIHNVQTMGGVFGVSKQLSYIGEVRELFFPMLKQARRKFPQQEPAYENIKHVLRSQVQLIEKINVLPHKDDL